MPISEQIGEISELDLVQINEKLRIIQRLFDGLFNTYGDDFLSDLIDDSD